MAILKKIFALTFVLLLGGCNPHHKAMAEFSATPQLVEVVKYVPVKQVDGTSLVIEGAKVSPFEFQKNTLAEILVKPDSRGDYVEFAMCQLDGDKLCAPTPEAPESFSLNIHDYPKAPVGKLGVMLRSCVSEDHAIDTEKRCGIWFYTPYEQPPNKDPKLGALLERSYDLRQHFASSCYGLRNILKKYKDESKFTTKVEREILENSAVAPEDQPRLQLAQVNTAVENELNMGEHLLCTMITSEEFPKFEEEQKEESLGYRILLTLGIWEVIYGSMLTSYGAWKYFGVKMPEVVKVQSLPEVTSMQPFQGASPVFNDAEVREYQIDDLESYKGLESNLNEKLEALKTETIRIEQEMKKITASKVQWDLGQGQVTDQSLKIVLEKQGQSADRRGQFKQFVEAYLLRQMRGEKPIQANDRFVLDRTDEKIAVMIDEGRKKFEAIMNHMFTTSKSRNGTNLDFTALCKLIKGYQVKHDEIASLREQLQEFKDKNREKLAEVERNQRIIDQLEAEHKRKRTEFKRLQELWDLKERTRIETETNAYLENERLKLQQNANAADLQQAKTKRGEHRAVASAGLAMVALGIVTLLSTKLIEKESVKLAETDNQTALVNFSQGLSNLYEDLQNKRKDIQEIDELLSWYVSTLQPDDAPADE